MTKQVIISKESEVPEGYVRMIDFGNNASGKLSTAAAAGIIPSVKLLRNETQTRGSIFLHEIKTQKFLDDLPTMRTKLPRKLVVPEVLVRIEGKIDALTEKLNALVEQFK